MKRPHFALPEIYDESLSYYDVLRKLIKSMHVMNDNLNKIPEQIANEAKARLLSDQNLQQNINAETSAREQADNALQEKINTNKNDISELKGELANKLPKSPTNWGPWTTEEQSVARDKIGIPWDYELIEKITVTEDLQKIERSYDLDGNMYAFRSILLISMFPNASDGRNKIENFRVTAKLNNNKFVDAFTSYDLNIFNNITYQLIQNQNGFYNMVFSECTSNKGHLNAYPAKISSNFELGDYIKSIQIETTLSANIYSGTVLKIYGVRA